MARLLCLKTTNPLSTRLLFPTPNCTSTTMLSHATAPAKLLLLASPTFITLLALPTLRMSSVKTGDIRLFGKHCALSCSDEVTPRQLPLCEFISPHELIEGSESRMISLVFRHESRTAAHPQQHPFLALVLIGSRSDSMPFGTGLCNIWCWSYFGSFSPTHRLGASAQAQNSALQCSPVERPISALAQLRGDPQVEMQHPKR